MFAFCCRKVSSRDDLLISHIHTHTHKHRERERERERERARERERERERLINTHASFHCLFFRNHVRHAELDCQFVDHKDCTCVAIITGLIVKWIMRRLRYKLPPGPSPLPIVGNMLQFKTKMMHEQMFEWSKTFGPVISVYLGPSVAGSKRFKVSKGSHGPKGVTLWGTSFDTDAKCYR